MDKITKLLFRSKYRRKIDERLCEVITAHTPSISLRNRIFYHLGIGANDIQPNYTLGHSKRFRAFLCFLSGEQNVSINDDVLLNLSISVELIHNATLIVDDIQDGDTERCSKTSLWKKYGIADAMNAAFFLSNLGQALFHKTASNNNLFDYSNLFLDVFGKVASGQQSDLDGQCKISNYNSYVQMVGGKTSTLLFLSCLLGVYPFGAKEEDIGIIREFCFQLGLLHQLNDDADDGTFCDLTRLHHKEVIHDYFISRNKIEAIISNKLFFTLCDGVVNREICTNTAVYGDKNG